MADIRPLDVVVAGGGVAALETVLALHDLAGDRVRLTIVAPQAEFELRALRTAEPFAADHVRHHALGTVAERVGARLCADSVTVVEAARHAVRLAGGGALSYDALVLAVGGRTRPAFSRALTFDGFGERDALFNGLLEDLEEGWSKSVAFVVPPGTTWPLPIYELALMTAAQVASMGVDDVTLAIVTPEEAPLGIFGAAAAAAVAELLERGGIAFQGDAYASTDEDGHIVLAPGGGRVTAQRIVALPLIDGPQLLGVPSDARGFVPVDQQGRVRGVPDVFAAGDGTTFPVKQGGLACQMADVIAEGLARRAGADVTPSSFRPVLRGHLLTPRGAEALEHPLGGGTGQDRPPALQLWSPPHKVNGRYLSAWLEEMEGVPEPRRDGIDVEVELPTAWEQSRTALRLDPYSPIVARQAI